MPLADNRPLSRRVAMRESPRVIARWLHCWPSCRKMSQNVAPGKDFSRRPGETHGKKQRSEGVRIGKCRRASHGWFHYWPSCPKMSHLERIFHADLAKLTGKTTIGRRSG